MSLNIGSIFSPGCFFISLEILRIENASEQRHGENLVLNNPYVIYMDSFAFMEKLWLCICKQVVMPFTVGKNYLLLNHSLGTLPSFQCHLYSFQFKPCIFHPHIQYLQCSVFFVKKLLVFQTCLIPVVQVYVHHL